MNINEVIRAVFDKHIAYSGHRNSFDCGPSCTKQMMRYFAARCLEQMKMQRLHDDDDHCTCCEDIWNELDVLEKLLRKPD